MKVQNIKNSFVLVGLISFIALGVFFYKSLAADLEFKDTSNVNANSPFKGSDQFIAGEYQNGTYTSVGGYISPGGPEEIEITVVLNNDIVNDIQITKKAKLPTSLFFQEKFESGFKEFIIGKNINEIKLDKVAGSSLTPIGFNDAIEKIKSQARS